MKEKLSLLMLLFLLNFCFSQITIRPLVEGEIVHLDGTVEKGFFKEPFHDDRRISFRDTKKGKSRTYKTNNLKQLSFYSKDKSLYFTYIALKDITFNLKFEIVSTKNKFWFGLKHEDKDFRILGVSSDIYEYGFNWKNEDFVMPLRDETKHFASVVVNKNGHMRYSSKRIFKDRCPELVKELENKTFRPKSMEEVLDYYRNKCQENNIIKKN